MTQSHPSSCQVVEIGGSAGGLQAFEQLFQALAPDTGAAYVVVQHLSVEQPSQLAEILARYTPMPVATAEEGIALAADHVYVSPPGRSLELAGDRLHLVEPESPRHPPSSIDHFFRSLAAARGDRSIAVVLSGMGEDGTLGLKAIKEAGGVTLAQSPESAVFNAMPRSAVASHVVDRVLDIEDLAAALEAYIHRDESEPPPITDDRLRPILDLLNQKRGHDLRDFKRPMVARRIARRMNLAGLNDVDQYTVHLNEQPKELDQLYRDLLISVTDFFRDAEAYDALLTQALPQLPGFSDDTSQIRAWVPACATGEEAYTVAMLLIDAARQRDSKTPVQVFASDIDSQALDIARVGVYPANSISDIAPQYRDRYFHWSDHHCQVTDDLRQHIVFALQDLLRDPPYSRLDLISCRNLLIYLTPDAQHYVFDLFHFALRDGGYLFLGAAETIGQADHLFEPVDQRHRIYRRLPASTERHYFNFPRSGRDTSKPVAQPRQVPPRKFSSEMDRIAQQLLLREYVPASVLINDKAEILCAYGPTQHYLGLGTGASRLDLMEMIAEDLHIKVRAAIHQAHRDGTRCQNTAVYSRPDDRQRTVRITARPLSHPAPARGLMLVTFEEVAGPVPTELDTGSPESVQQQMADELRALHEELQETIRSQEATNEDLQSSNEEVMSMNEELQSTNEELETSKEELQSLNEELFTVNRELQDKVVQLERLNSDLDSMSSGAQVATLYLDSTLCIVRYNQAAQQLLHLQRTDIGRPLSDVSPTFDDPQLLHELAAVLKDLSAINREVTHEHGGRYRRRITPDSTASGTVKGVMVTFTHITAMNQAIATARSSGQQRRLLADTLPVLVAYIDKAGRIAFSNTAFEDWLGPTSGRLDEQTLESLWGAEHFKAVEKHITAANCGRHVTYVDRLNHPVRGLQTLQVSLIPVLEGDGLQSGGFYFLATDITEQKAAESMMLERQAKTAHASWIASMSELAGTIAHQLSQPLMSISQYTGALKRLLVAENESEPKEIINKIALQAEVAGDILNELREFIGRRTYDQEPIDCNALVRRVVALTEGRSTKTRATVQLTLAPELPKIMGSPVQFEQMLLNLVVNALEAVAEVTTRELHLRTATDGDDIVISVSDTGYGIQTTHLNRLFDAFYSGKKDGMGMGLAISRGIAEEYGGSIWAESGKNGGASFYIRLPVDNPL